MFAKKMISLLFIKKINSFIFSILIKFPQSLRQKFKKFPVMDLIEIKLYNDKRIILNNWDGKDAIASRLFWAGIENYDKNEIKLFQQILDCSDYILDIGSNTGIYTLIAGVNNKKVHSFEPVPFIYERLIENIRINGLLNVIPNNKVVTDYNGFTSLFVPDSITLPTSASTLDGFRVAKETIIIPTITLDSYIFSENIPKVDVIKIDTEATEDKVLWGSKNIIKRDNPIIICEVLHNRCEEGLNMFFKNKNSCKTALEYDSQLSGIQCY